MGIEDKRRRIQISKELFRGIFSKPTDQNTDREVNKTVISNEDHTGSLEKISTQKVNTYLGANFFPDYIDSQKGKPFIIAGCGESINNFDDLSDFMVIGINDIGRILTPNYLVVVNHQRTFTRGRFEWVTRSKSPVILSHIDPGVLDNRNALVKINLGSKEAPNLEDRSKIDYTMNSPYMGAIIAYQLGASKIGLIGVDFTPNHFFGETGNHVLARNIKMVNEEYDKLGKALISKGVKIANLSPTSSIESWPKMNLDQFRNL
jgi:hypothetical protein